MLRDVAVPAPDQLTPRARSYAYPSFSEAARKILEEAKSAAPSAIDADELKSAAASRTSLSDFGEAPLDEPLSVLCRSLNHEVELHALGRTYARQQLLGLLSTRLRLVDLWRRHPEILDIPIERPIIIIGLPRSGTTILHKLLARDPARCTSPFWEQVMPLPVAQGPEDPRPALVQASLDTLYTLAPEFVSMHEMSVDEPDEDITQLIFGFASKQFEWSYVVPSYAEFYRRADHRVGYQWFRRILQTSLWLRPRPNRWILKAPQHLENLGALTASFPDAVLVQTHRDPTDAVVSLASMTCYGQRRYFDHPNPHVAGSNMERIIERLLRLGEEARPTLKQPVVDLLFQDLLADPIACVRRIYTAAGDELSAGAEAEMSAWIDQNRQHKHGKHEYAAEDVGLSLGELQRRFEFYRPRFEPKA
jgi:hypothetical protein